MSELTTTTVAPASPFPWKVLSPATTWQQRLILLYGPSGVGKTRLAAQFPSPLLLSCDPGSMGGALSAVNFGIKQLKIANYQDLMSLMPVLKAQAGIEFKTIIIDSVTYLGKLVMQNILANANRELPRFEEWGLNYTRTARLINNFAEMNCHVIFTAIDKTDKDEVTGKMFGGPSLPGQLQKELPQAVDVCARLFTTTGYGTDGKLQVKYLLRTVPDDLWFAKDRTQKLPKEGTSEFSTFKCLFDHEDQDGKET